MSRDDDLVAYSLLKGEEQQEDNSRHVQLTARTMARSSQNTFAGRLRGFQRIAFLVMLTVFFLVIFWLLASMERARSRKEGSIGPYQLGAFGGSPSIKPDGSTRPTDFLEGVAPLGYGWYEENCYNDKKMSRSIGDIYRKLQMLKDSSSYQCHIIWLIFNNMLRMEEIESPIVLPSAFQDEVKGWLGGDEKLFDQVNHQVVYKVVNKGTFEETVYNPIRSKRPTSKAAMDPLEYIKNLTKTSAPNCDFCKYEDHTAKDTFGRIVNEYSASASNTFKLAKFHGLFFPLQHHPLNLSLAQLQDLFIHTSMEWFQKAHEVDPNQKYPSLMWDTLPHAGASQVHPHVHGVLDAYQYVGGFESWHQLSVNYFKQFHRSFWTDFVRLHFALGLAIHRGNTTVALVPITARKDHEYMIISSEMNEDVVSLLYDIIQTYQKELGVYCFSSGGVYPKLGTDSKDDTGMPVIFRIGSRGSCTSIGSDVSSLELYTINNINSDIAKTYDGLVKHLSDSNVRFTF